MTQDVGERHKKMNVLDGKQDYGPKPVDSQIKPQVPVPEVPAPDGIDYDTWQYMVKWMMGAAARRLAIVLGTYCGFEQTKAHDTATKIILWVVIGGSLAWSIYSGWQSHKKGLNTPVKETT